MGQGKWWIPEILRGIKSMTKTLRFKVFHRDGFTCQYCGQKPPDVILEADHIVAKSKGGTEIIDNLITACFDCNRGKSNKDLKKVPKKIKENLEEIKERRKQLKEFFKYQIDIANSDIITMIHLTQYWSNLWDGEYELNIRGEASIKRFLKALSADEIKESMAIACERISNVNNAWKYCCGIMWNKVKVKKIII